MLLQVELQYFVAVMTTMTDWNRCMLHAQVAAFLYTTSRAWGGRQEYQHPTSSPSPDPWSGFCWVPLAVTFPRFSFGHGSQCAPVKQLFRKELPESPPRWRLSPILADTQNWFCAQQTDSEPVQVPSCWADWCNLIAQTLKAGTSAMSGIQGGPDFGWYQVPEKDPV